MLWYTFRRSRTGRGAVWQRTCFGSRGSEVQILSPRPKGLRAGVAQW